MRNLAAREPVEEAFGGAAITRLPDVLQIQVEMVSCSDFVRDYSDYRDGLLEPAELAAAEGHLLTCASCQRYQRVVDGGIRELLAVPEIEPSDDFLGKLQHRIYHIDAEKGFASREASGASIAFVLLLLAVIAAASWSPVVREASNTVALPPVAAAAPVEELETLTLFTPGPLLIPKSSPVRLVSSRESDLFSGYGLGAYVASRHANLPR